MPQLMPQLNPIQFHIKPQQNRDMGIKITLPNTGHQTCWTQMKIGYFGVQNSNGHGIGQNIQNLNHSLQFLIAGPKWKYKEKVQYVDTIQNPSHLATIIGKIYLSTLLTICSK